MSKRDRHDRGALIALGLILFAVVFLALLEVGARQAFDTQIRQPQAAENNYANDYRGPAEGHWWPEFAARDTYAQWAMSFLAIIATATGILGVIWIRQTLEATRETAKAAIDANKTARDIGQAQVRAYVSWDGVRSSVSFDAEKRPVAFSFACQIKNTGLSPARIRGLYAYLSVLPNDEVPTVEFDPVTAECRDEIGGGNSFGFIGLTASLQEALQIFERKRRGYLLGWCAYRDIFWIDGDPDRELRFCFEIEFRMNPTLVTIDLAKVTAFYDLQSIPKYEVRAVVAPQQHASD